MKTILQVNHNPSFSAFIREILEPLYGVYSTCNGLEAICWMQKGHFPDLILSDTDMTVMTGLELLNAVKSSGVFQDIPVIMLGDQNSSNDRLECLRLGATDYLSKPFNPEELLVKIERILMNN